MTSLTPEYHEAQANTLLRGLKEGTHSAETQRIRDQHVSMALAHATLAQSLRLKDLNDILGSVIYADGLRVRN